MHVPEGDTLSYGVIVRIAAPISIYDQTYTEIGEMLDGEAPDGLILHVARATTEGFEMLEVWESEERADKFSSDILGPTMERNGLNLMQMPSEAVEFIEFDPRSVLALRVYSSDLVRS